VPTHIFASTLSATLTGGGSAAYAQIFELDCHFKSNRHIRFEFEFCKPPTIEISA